MEWWETHGHFHKTFGTIPRINHGEHSANGVF